MFFSNVETNFYNVEYNKNGKSIIFYLCNYKCSYDYSFTIQVKFKVKPSSFRNVTMNRSVALKYYFYTNYLT